MKQTGLVLEGGGMRGVFTCGVLDYSIVLWRKASNSHTPSVSLQEHATGFRTCRTSKEEQSSVTSTCWRNIIISD